MSNTLTVYGLSPRAIQVFPSDGEKQFDIRRMRVKRCTQSDHKTEPGPYRVCRRCGGEY